MINGERRAVPRAKRVGDEGNLSPTGRAKPVFVRQRGATRDARGWINKVDQALANSLKSAKPFENVPTLCHPRHSL